MNLSIEKFHPKLAELAEMADAAKKIVVKGVDDVEGMTRLKESARQLQKARTSIKDIGKALREESNAFNKAVLDKERELLEIVVPVESALKEQREEIERLQEIEKRKELLPERVEELADLGIEATDEELLEMSTGKYNEFKNQKLSEKLEKERLELEQEKQKIEEEKERIENENARIEREAIEKVEREKREAAAEKQRIADEKRIEAEKVAAVAQAKKEAEENAKAEAERVEHERLAKIAEEAEAKRAEEEKARKNKKYTDWKKGLDDSALKIERDGDTFIAYKEVSRITIS